MPLRVLIAPDKFKGTLTASQAARAIATGWRKARPQDDIILLPIADGGDGFGNVLGTLWRAQSKTICTVDAARRPIRARWWWEPSRKAVVIESAAIIGLAPLPPGRFHPFELDTYGLAKVILAVAKLGARRCIIGIGGSATNDAGFGLARALGWTFLDRAGQPIESWIDLHMLAQIKPAAQAIKFPELTVAVDVQNRLLGKRGATRVYGPQKGLTTRDFARAEKALRRLAQVVTKDLGAESENVPGAGAAGGLGFGLAAFLGARLEPGFDLFAREADLVTEVRRADLVITGEGRLDNSSLMGKGVGELARLCRRLKVPYIGLAGDILRSSSLHRAFTRTAALTTLTSPSTAQAKPAFWLTRLSAKTALAL